MRLEVGSLRLEVGGWKFEVRSRSSRAPARIPFLPPTQRGQEGDVFRLAIAAILGLAIFAIVIGVVLYFGELKRQVAFEQMEKGFADARENLALSCVSLKSFDECETAKLDKRIFCDAVVHKPLLFFRKETSFNSLYFGQLAKLPPECVSFQTWDPQFVLLSNDGRAAQVQGGDYDIDVFFVCYREKKDPSNPSVQPLACPDKKCVISFGKLPSCPSP